MRRVRQADGGVVEMADRIVHRLARGAVSAPCSRCLTIVDLVAGQWHAAEHGNPSAALCDRCAQQHDPDGYSVVVAFRRMAAAGPSIGRTV